MLTLPLNGQPLELSLDNYQWTCVLKPQTTATLALSQEGLKVHFTIKEQNPLVTATVQQEPMLMTCQDSTVELFLAFADHEDEPNFQPKLEHCMYANLEINSAGICYAKYGHSRKNRTAFSKEEIAYLQIKTEILENEWTVDFVVPTQLVQKIAGYDAFKQGQVFAFNLYKISETKTHEHYISYHKIEVDKPNFHLPEYFQLVQVA